jgi:tetratricopeptide (TPR) repeat protein
MNCKLLAVGLLGSALLLSGCASVGNVINRLTGEFASAKAERQATEKAQANDLTEASSSDARQQAIATDSQALGAVAKNSSRMSPANDFTTTLTSQDWLALVNSDNRLTQSKREHSDVTRARLIKALDAYTAEQFSQALGLIEPLTASSEPLNSSAYVLVGDIYMALAQQQSDTHQQQQNTQLAEQSFDTALSINSQNYKAANRRALLHRQQGEFTQALSLYNRAISAYPGDAVSYRNRGVLHDLYMGNKVAALADYAAYAGLLEVQYEYQQLQAQGNAPLLNGLEAAAVKGFLAPDLLQAELRRVKGWQLDIKRQIQSASNAHAENSAQPADEQLNSIAAVETPQSVPTHQQGADYVY